MTILGQPSPFERYKNAAWPYRFESTMHIRRVCGGVPSDEKTAEAWIRSKLKDTRSKSEIQKVVDDTIAELRLRNEQAGITAPDSKLVDEAVAQTAEELAGLNVFKRTPEGVLYLEGRQLKAALKEGVSVAANAGKVSTKGWGNPDNAAYKKQIKGWFPEHVFIEQEVMPLFKLGLDDKEVPVRGPDGVLQKFVHTHRGDAIGYEEYVDDALIKFTVKTDYLFTEKDWAMFWLTAQEQGVGASRSQGYGVYEVVSWKDISKPGAAVVLKSVGKTEDKAADSKTTAGK